MKQSNAIKAALVASGLVLGGTAFAETPSATMLAYTCAGCHGTGGNSMGPATPTIAGHSKDYIVEAMQEYKSGDRPSTIMERIAKGYSDEEFEAMGEYFAAQPFVPAKQEPGKNAKKGAKLHDKYCEKCHSEGGSTAEDDVILAGQWVPYLQYSMEDFMSGKRKMTKKMKKKVEQMHKKEGDAGTAAVIDFYGSAK